MKRIVMLFLAALVLSQVNTAQSSPRTLPMILPVTETSAVGVARIVNHSEQGGEVLIHAIDDTGKRFGPVTLHIEAGESRHFNSRDLEEGGSARLVQGVGDGEGNWRLKFVFSRNEIWGPVSALDKRKKRR